ncbi:MAG: hypothetical protein ACLRZH_11750 [Ruthenibacterium lactatiformans]
MKNRWSASALYLIPLKNFWTKEFRLKWIPAAVWAFLKKPAWRYPQAVSVATGCTEPVAIELCAAAAREASTGAPEEITVRLDMGLYKNALGVVVPGVNKRSVVLCAALGAAAGKTSDGMNIFASMGPAEWKKAEALVPITHVTVAAEARSLYAEATIRTRQSHVRAVIKETHDRISKIEAYPFSKDNFQLPAPNAFLRSLTLRHMLAFAQNIPGGDWIFWTKPSR